LFRTSHSIVDALGPNRFRLLRGTIPLKLPLNFSSEMSSDCLEETDAPSVSAPEAAEETVEMETAIDAVVQLSDQEDRTNRERQQARELRRAARRARRLAAAQQREENARYPLRQVQLSLPRVKDPVKLNAAVTLIGIACVWSLVIWCVGTYF
jgi:hypothetical protein